MVTLNNFFKKLKILFLDLISFNTPQSIVINLSSIIIFLILFPVRIIESYPYVSINKYVFPIFFGGIDNCPTSGIFKACCPSCGMTRAFSRLLKGDIFKALEHNKLVIIIALVVLFLIIHNTLKWINYYKKTSKLYPFN